MYLFSLYVVLLLSSRFTASALVWLSNFLKYLVFHFFILLGIVFICRSSQILQLFMYQGAFVYVPRCVQNGLESLGLKALADSAWTA
jgi:hypothetical protein